MAGWRRAFALALACLAATPQAPVAAAEDPTPTVRILLVGDSVTQGSAGDYTWRYRLWEALTDAEVDVDLVGPRRDLYDNVADQLGSTAYAEDIDPDFDADHAARWGMTLAEPDVPLADLVAEYEPDVVVEMRGMNDLAWLGESSTELASRVAAEIEDARAVDPDVDFVVGQLPQIWAGVDEAGRTSAAVYDEDRLPALAASMDTQESRVVVAQSGSGFVELTDTWDPAHLSASGEVRLAAAVTDALAALGIGAPYPRPLPVVDNGHWAAATGLTAAAEEQAVRLAWVRPPGAAEQYVWVRDVTAGRVWERLPLRVSGATWTVGLLAGGHTYEFRLQSAKGAAVSASFSAVVRATALVRPPDPPAAVTGLTITPGPQLLSLAWLAVPGATSYDVAWSGQDGPSGVLNVLDPWAVLTGLRPGSAYTVTVTARNGGGASAPAAATGVPASPPLPPAAPQGLRLVPGRHQLRLTWHAGAPGTTYDVGLVGETTGYRGHRAVAQAQVRFGGLLAGERYTLLVTPLNDAGAGPLAQVSGRPTGPHAAGPAGLVARALRDGRVRLAWRPAAHATTYDVALRRAGRWSTVRSSSATRATLDLGSGPLRLRVRSWHQRLPGGWSGVVRLRVP